MIEVELQAKIKENEQKLARMTDELKQDVHYMVLRLAIKNAGIPLTHNWTNEQLDDFAQKYPVVIAPELLSHLRSVCYMGQEHRKSIVEGIKSVAQIIGLEIPENYYTTDLKINENNENIE